jgi:hypothetical protein
MPRFVSFGSALDRRRAAGAFILAGSLVATACGSGLSSPTMPSGTLGAGSGAALGAALGGAAVVRSAGQTKVEVCHRTFGTNEYVLIDIADPALPTHLSHGDAQVGEAVPDAPGFHFGETCELVEYDGGPTPD